MHLDSVHSDKIRSRPKNVIIFLVLIFVIFFFSFSVWSFLIIDFKHLKYISLQKFIESTIHLEGISRGFYNFNENSHFPLCSTIFFHIQHISKPIYWWNVDTYQFNMLWSHTNIKGKRYKEEKKVWRRKKHIFVVVVANLYIFVSQAEFSLVKKIMIFMILKSGKQRVEIPFYWMWYVLIEKETLQFILNVKFYTLIESREREKKTYKWFSIVLVIHCKVGCSN